MKKVAIVQSNYIPWKGYFDLIAAVDEFILFDETQYTRRDWRNRNRIKTPQGLAWLTVPVVSKGRFLQPIRDTEIQGEGWAADHWKSLTANYAKAAHFEAAAAFVAPLYRQAYTTVSELNRAFIEAVCTFLGIPTRLTWSWDYPSSAGRTERLAGLCRQVGADIYVSGPAARAYLDETAFAAFGIGVQWFDYDNYPVYPQLWGEFEHRVSILDLLFNCGRDAPKFMRYVR